MHSDAILEDRIAGYEQVLHRFLHRRHRVLILFPEQQMGSLGWLMAQAVERCGCVSVSAGGDFRWKNLLRLAFSSRTETVIGTPQMILGLHKAAKATNTPLFIHDVLLCGSSKPWQRDGIRKGLDCRVWRLEEDTFGACIPEHPDFEPLRSALEDQLLSWSSILDFSAVRTESGIALEVITFPGEKIPKLPSCAKLMLRYWNPETDVPFSLKTFEK